jgi:hypothetical protein
MQVKSTVRYHVKPIKLADMKKSDNIKCGKDVKIYIFFGKQSVLLSKTGRCVFA